MDKHFYNSTEFSWILDITVKVQPFFKAQLGLFILVNNERNVHMLEFSPRTEDPRPRLIL